jgi:hypothetical protein
MLEALLLPAVLIAFGVALRGRRHQLPTGVPEVPDNQPLQWTGPGVGLAQASLPRRPGPGH